MGLPSKIEEMHIYGHPKEGERLFAAVKEKDGEYDFIVVDEDGKIYLEVEGYGTAEFMGGMDEELLKPLKEVVES